jgi:hypothetical protein
MEQTKEEEEEGVGGETTALTFNCTENMSSTMATEKSMKESLGGNVEKKKKSLLSSKSLSNKGGVESAKKSEKKSKSICLTSKSEKSTLLKVVNTTINKENNTTVKKLNKTVGFASGTKDASKVSVKEDKSMMSNQDLVKRVEELEAKVEQSKSDWIKYEADLRRELVSKWSKRVEDQDAFHQEEIKKQRIQVEDHWSKKMSMLEELCEIRTSNQLKESDKEHQIQLDKLQNKIVEMEAELKKTYEQLDSVKASLKTVTDKNLLQVKAERMSQSGFDTHLRLEEKDEDHEEEEEEEEESIYTSAKTSDKTGLPAKANDSHTNKRKLSLDSYEEDDYGIGDNNGMEYEVDISSYGATNFANGSKNSLGSKSKRRNTSIVNHSMQTDMLRGGNISVQTEVIQRRSIGTEVFYKFFLINYFMDENWYNCDLAKSNQSLNFL